MSVNKAVHRLHVDIQKLHKAQNEHQKDAHQYRKDQRELKKDHKRLEKHVKDGKHEHKVLDRHHSALQKNVDARQKQLDKLEQQRQAIIAQYGGTDTFDADPTDPTNPLTQDPAEQMALAGIDQQEAAVHGKYDSKIDSQRTQVQADRDSIQKLRDSIHADRNEVKHDRRDLKHDRKELKHDRNAVKHARHKALHDLRPAEYKMGLHATNKARHELGLKAVHDVIRPGVKQTVPGQVGKWIAEAQTILKQHGIPLSKMNAQDIATIIKFESGGNPNAQNNWDSNAAAGHPSIGLMQTIGPTFNAYKLPGHGNIRNPIDNIIAGVRYAISRYGSIGNVPGIRAVHAGGSYVGY